MHKQHVMCTAQRPPAAAWMEDDLHPTARTLQACVRASARRGAGLDGWAPKQRLPLDFYELLARLWAACLFGACPQPGARSVSFA